MFLSINRTTTQSIILTATEGRGTLNEARIVFENLTTTQQVTLTKTNISTKRSRYDEFPIEAADLEDLEEGEFLYTVYASDNESNEGLDPDTPLETGRGRITTTFVTTEVVYDNQPIEKVYERA